MGKVSSIQLFPNLFSIENTLTVENMSQEERELQLATGTLD